MIPDLVASRTTFPTLTFSPDVNRMNFVPQAMSYDKNYEISAHKYIDLLLYSSAKQMP